MGFPKHVFVKGTGKKVNDDGLYTADYIHVETAEELAAMDPGTWCESPADAVVAGKGKAKETTLAQALDAASFEAEGATKLEKLPKLKGK